MVKKGDMMSTEDIISRLPFRSGGCPGKLRTVVFDQSRSPACSRQGQQGRGRFQTHGRLPNGENVPLDKTSLRFTGRMKRLIWN